MSWQEMQRRAEQATEQAKKVMAVLEDEIKELKSTGASEANLVADLLDDIIQNAVTTDDTEEWLDPKLVESALDELVRYALATSRSFRKRMSRLGMASAKESNKIEQTRLVDTRLPDLYSSYTSDIESWALRHENMLPIESFDELGQILVKLDDVLMDHENDCGRET